MIKMNRNRRVWSLIGVVVMMGITLVPTVSLATNTSGEKTCLEIKVPVALEEGKSANYKIYRKLCYRGNPEGITVQILVHGAMLSHIYWDFPYQSERYFYDENVTLDGYATFITLIALESKTVIGRQL